MTTKDFNTHIDAIESIINEKLIPLIANVLKAIVTLICLAIKATIFVLNYIYKIAGGEAVDAAKEFAKNIRENPTLQCNDVTKSLMISVSINDAMGLKLSNHQGAGHF